MNVENLESLTRQAEHQAGTQVQAALTTVEAPQATPFINAVYYPNYRVYRQQPPSSLNTEYITHIFYAFAWPIIDGSIEFSDEYADKQIECDGVKGALNALAKLKRKNPRLNLLLSIGGGGPGSKHFATVAKDSVLRQKFAAKARALVDEYSLDGIDSKFPPIPYSGKRN